MSYIVTEEDRQQAFKQVQEYLITGLTDAEIMARLKDQFPFSKSTTRRKWLNGTKERIAEAHRKSEDGEFDLALAKARFLDLYQKARDKGDLELARKLLVDLARLTGAMATPSKNLTFNQQNNYGRIEDQTEEQLLDAIPGTVIIPQKRLENRE